MNKNEQNNVDLKLLSILSTEIQRDGGSSLVRDLKDYVHNTSTNTNHINKGNNKRNDNNVNIDSLLKQSTTSKNSKLLTFLETHQAIFEVDRNTLPHVVYLVSTDYCTSFDDETEETEQHQQYQEQKQQHLLRAVNQFKQSLKDRILFIIRKEKSKNQRRGNFSSTTTNNDESSFASSVSLHWLLKQCKTQLHYYLRMNGYYQNVYTDCKDVHRIGSNGWYELISTEFLNVVNEMEDCVYYNDGRVFLRHMDRNKTENNNVEELAKTLIEKVEEDGGTHISLSLLLHRYPELNQIILNGSDLMQMKDEYEEMFAPIDIFIKHNEIYLQRKSVQHDKNNNNNNKGRMEVDETGLFSVASSKWGNAFTSLMVNHCRNHLRCDPTQSIAIDLTASVGGVTLPLAKAFKNVIACEIDKHRSVLCQRNMCNFGVEDKVEVLNEDSIEYLPMIARKCGDETKVVIVDPPWGGKYYKSEKCEILLGPWTMVDVIEKISQYLSPTIIGFRMPLSYDYKTLLDSLRTSSERQIQFEKLEIKKAGPQLFIVIAV